MPYLQREGRDGAGRVLPRVAGSEGEHVLLHQEQLLDPGPRQPARGLYVEIFRDINQQRPRILTSAVRCPQRFDELRIVKWKAFTVQCRSSAFGSFYPKYFGNNAKHWVFHL